MSMSLSYDFISSPHEYGTRNKSHTIVATDANTLTITFFVARAIKGTVSGI